MKRGTIEPRGSRFRVRVSVRGERVDLGTYDTRDKAEAIAKAFAEAESEGEIEGPAERTVGGYVAGWMDRRERTGRVRGIDEERSVVAAHILTAPFAKIALESLRVSDVDDWMHAMIAAKLKRDTIKRPVSLLRGALQDAVRRELLTTNVAAVVKVPKLDTEADEDTWTYLTPAEIQLLERSDAISDRQRSIFLAAAYTGMRRGAVFALRWEDVHLDDRPHIWIRRSLSGATKSGKKRRIPLIPRALAVFRGWARISGNPTKGLVFPSRGGRMHAKGYVAGWDDKRERRGKGGALRTVPGARTRAGISRHVRFHDLRHTCASHLIMGSWTDRPWRLEEVRVFMGHSTVQLTERYAHLAPGVLDEAARGPVPELSQPPEGDTRKGAESLGGWDRGRTCDHRLVRALVPPTIPRTSIPIGAALGQDHGSALRELAERALIAVGEDDPRHVALLLRLAEAVMLATEQNTQSEDVG